MNSRYSRAGFTIWQVAIVLASLAVVAALLFPVFQPVPMTSTRASCQSDMKQLGLAFAQYEQDADQQTPPDINVEGNGWAGQVYPYVKSTGVYRCPADKQEGSNYVSYTENRNAARKPLSQFAEPDATVQLYEETTLNCDPSTLETVSGTGTIAPGHSKRHSEENFGLNFLLMDGHVKYLRPGVVSSGPGALRSERLGAYRATFALQ